MTIEEKIDHLKNAAMEEARAEGNAVMQKHRDTLNHLFEAHKAESIKQSETRVKAESTNARRQLNTASSKSQIELKRELGKTQKELTKRLFSEVEQLLIKYMRTEDYKRLLISYIEDAAKFAGKEELVLYINPTDEDKKEYLEEHTGFALTISREDFIGGVKAVIYGRNILIDHSFKGALEAQRAQFLFEGGTYLEQNR